MFRRDSPVVGTQSTPFDLPGFALPLDFKPKVSKWWCLPSSTTNQIQRHFRDIVYPNALDTEDIEGGYVG